jgi:hypothetical protein
VPSCCACSGTPTCPPSTITILDSAAGGHASGVTIEVYDRQWTNPSAVLVDSGTSPLALGVLPVNPFGSYYVKVIDDDNAYPVPFAYSAWITISRCGSLTLQYCKVTVDADVESGATLTALAAKKSRSPYDAAIGWYSTANAVGWGVWVTPTRNVAYFLSYSNGTVSNPIAVPWIVTVSAELAGTFGNCDQVQVDSCGDSKSVSLPLYHFEGIYYPAPDNIGPGCFDIGCAARGPGPNFTGTLHVTLAVTFTPYRFDGAAWVEDHRVLGSDWGTSIDLTYDEALGYWTSGCRGGNGRFLDSSYGSYTVPVVATRVTYGETTPGDLFAPGLHNCRYYQYADAGDCASGVATTYDIVGDPIECVPTDMVVVHAVTGPGGGDLTWFEAHE